MLKAGLLVIFASCPLIAEAAVMHASYEGAVNEVLYDTVGFFGGENPIGQPFWAEFTYDTDNGVVEVSSLGQFLYQGQDYGNGEPGSFTARSTSSSLTRQGNEALNASIMPEGFQGVPQLSHSGLSRVGTESIGLIFQPEVVGSVPMSFDEPWSGDVVPSPFSGSMTWFTITDEGPIINLWFNLSVTSLTVSSAPALVPLPPALPLLGASLLALAGLRRRAGRSLA